MIVIKKNDGDSLMQSREWKIRGAVVIIVMIIIITIIVMMIFK